VELVRRSAGHHHRAGSARRIFGQVTNHQSWEPRQLESVSRIPGSSKTTEFLYLETPNFSFGRSHPTASGGDNRESHGTFYRLR